MPEKTASKRFSTKKCPECLTPLPLSAQRCTACNNRVGPVNSIGIAKKPVDWIAYLMAIVAVGAFCGFMWFLYHHHN